MGKEAEVMAKCCFVIMPFSQTTEKHTEAYWTNLYYEFIKPTVEKFGYLCKRSQAQPSNIIKNILTELTEADLVLAVLTDYSANVWYELGIRHGRCRGTIMAIERGQTLPFDINQYGVIQYRDTLEGVTDFEKKLKTFIDTIENFQLADNPAAEFLEPIMELDSLEFKKELEEIRNQNEEKEKEIMRKLQAAKSKHERSREENRNLCDENRKVKQQNDELFGRVSTLEYEISELRRTLQAVKSEYTKSREENRKVKQQNDELLNRVNTLEYENLRLQRKLGN